MINKNYETVIIGQIEFHIDKDGDLEIDFSDYDYGTTIYADKNQIAELVEYLNKYVN